MTCLFEKSSNGITNRDSTYPEKTILGLRDPAEVSSPNLRQGFFREDSVCTSISVIKLFFTLTHRNVTELLFHPANLRYSSLAEEGTENMTADQYRDLIAKMNNIYRRIGDKLNSWRNKEQGSEGDDGRPGSDANRSIKCDSTANTEICNLG